MLAFFWFASLTCLAVICIKKNGGVLFLVHNVYLLATDELGGHDEHERRRRSLSHMLMHAISWSSRLHVGGWWLAWASFFDVVAEEWN